MHHGGKGPAWCNTLNMAAEWGVPPWQVTGEEPTRWRRLVWRERWAVYRGTQAEKQRLDAERLKRKRRG